MSLWPSDIVIEKDNSPRDIMNLAGRELSTLTKNVLSVSIRENSLSDRVILRFIVENKAYSLEYSLFEASHQLNQSYPVVIEPPVFDIPDFLKRERHIPESPGFLSAPALAMHITGASPGRTVKNEWVCATPDEFRDKLKSLFAQDYVKACVISLQAPARGAAVACPVCKREASEDVSKPRSGDHSWIACSRCGGTFEIGGSYYHTRRHTSEPLPIVSAMLRHAFEREESRPILNDPQAQRLVDEAPQSPDARAKRLLEMIGQKAERCLDNRIILTHALDYPLAFAADEQELLLCLNHLAEQGWIKVEHESSTTTCTMTASGVKEIEHA